MTDRLAIRLSWCFFIFVATAGSLGATTFTASQSGNWSSASTWGGAGVPGAGDTASITSFTVTLDGPVTVANLTVTNATINGSQALTVTSAFNWNGGTLTGGGTTSIPSGSTMTLGGYGNLDGRSPSFGGTLNITSSYYFSMLNNASLRTRGSSTFSATAASTRTARL